MRYFLALNLLISLISSSPAALEPESKTPYQLKVVVRFGDHPHFTPHFRSEFKKDLYGSLQAALGTMGNVEVVDLKSVEPEKWEPLWRLVEEKGLSALDTFNDVSNSKTHFLQIDYVDGQYEVRSRQHDGSTGYCTPQTRKTRTRDRGFVTRLGTLAIGQDFGIVASVEPPKGGNTSPLQLKGGGLNVSFDKWVKKGDVFAVIQLRQFQPPLPKAKGKEPVRALPLKIVGARMEGVLVQATDDPKGGICACTMFHRYDDPLPIRGQILGYRCIKLGTSESTLKLQLVDEKGVPHKPGVLQVRVHAERFPEQPNDGEEAPLTNGVFQSKRTFPNVALVRITLGDRSLARIPIEITGDQVIVRQVRIEAGAETRTRLEFARRDAMSRITDARLIQVRLIQDMSALEKENKKEDALKRGDKTYKAVQTDTAEIEEELSRLGKRVERDLPGTTDFLKDCEQQLVVLKDKQSELLDHIDKLKEAIRLENDPTVIAKRKQIQEAVRQAEFAAQQANYDEALKKYEEAASLLEDPEAKAKVQATHDALKKAWEIRDDDHKAARTFIYETWPKLDSSQAIKEALPEARKSFEKCKSVADKLTLNKMLLTAPEVSKPLVTQIEELLNSSSPEDVATLMGLKMISDELEKLIRELTMTIKGS